MLRSRLNPEERRGLAEGPTEYPTGRNRQVLRCGMCGRAFYVAPEILQGVSEAVETGLDNPFLCAACEEEYDELAYDG
jgi:hypothetical protein